MGDIVNLNRARKRLLREAERERAAANRLRHGQTALQRARARAEGERIERKLDGAALTPGETDGKDAT